MITTTFTCDRCETDHESKDIQRWGIGIESPGYAQPSKLVWAMDLCFECRAVLRLKLNPSEDPVTDVTPDRDLVGALEILRDWIDDALDRSPSG